MKWIKTMFGDGYVNLENADGIHINDFTGDTNPRSKEMQNKAVVFIWYKAEEVPLKAFTIKSAAIKYMNELIGVK